MPLIYSGQEAGLNKRLNFFEKDAIEWKEHKFASLYRNLLKLKKENKALFTGIEGGALEIIHTSNDDAIFSFVRKNDNKKILVILNLSGEKQSVTFNDFRHNDIYKDAFTQESKLISVNTRFDLNPWDYKIYIK